MQGPGRVLKYEILCKSCLAVFWDRYRCMVIVRPQRHAADCYRVECNSRQKHTQTPKANPFPGLHSDDFLSLPSSGPRMLQPFGRMRLAWVFVLRDKRIGVFALIEVCKCMIDLAVFRFICSSCHSFSMSCVKQMVWLLTCIGADRAWSGAPRASSSTTQRCREPSFSPIWEAFPHLYRRFDECMLRLPLPLNSPQIYNCKYNGGETSIEAAYLCAVRGETRNMTNMALNHTPCAPRTINLMNWPGSAIFIKVSRCILSLKLIGR